MVTPIDTLGFILRSNQVGGRLLDAVSPYLDADRVKYKSKPGSIEVESIEYKIDNLTFYIADDYLKLYKGSLCKWSLGNNVQSMTGRDLNDAVSNLSDIFHLPIEKASITRLDVGWNIITEQPPECYYSFLGQLARFQRCIDRHTLYYRQEGCRKEIKFYNKGRECKGDLPSIYNGKNVLRYEISFMNHVGQQLKVGDLNIAWLYDYDNAQIISQTLHSYYKQIKKIRDYMIDFNSIKGVKELDLLGRLLVIEKVGGMNNLLEQLNSAQRQGKLQRQNKSKIKDALMSAVSNSKPDSITAKSELIAELDKKMLEESLAK